MKKFEINFENGGLFIRHSAFPECIIEVIQLESLTMWSEVAGYDDIFDLFRLVHDDDNVDLYMLLVSTFIDHDDADDVPDEDVKAYRRMLRKAWKWVKFKYLIPKVELPAQPRFIAMNRYVEEDNRFSIERTDEGIFITHRLYPIFMATVVGNTIEVADMMEDIPPDPLLIASVLREMGDWYAQLRF